MQDKYTRAHAYKTSRAHTKHDDVRTKMGSGIRACDIHMVHIPVLAVSWLSHVFAFAVQCIVNSKDLLQDGPIGNV